MLIVAQVVLYALIFAFGACIFSFLNVVIYRLPKKLSFVKGFSACPSCGHRLYAKDMVPILSWTLLTGKCRYCKAPVSPRYTIVELMGGIAAVLCAVRFGFQVQAVLMFLFLGLLAVVAFIDLDTMEIPDELPVAILVLGIFTAFFIPEVGALERVIRFFAVSVPLLLITLIIPGGFGGGDIKLMAACGVVLGWKQCLLSCFIAIIIGGLYGIYLLASKKMAGKDHFAFGPFLCIGMVICVFMGKSILSWYLGMFPQF